MDAVIETLSRLRAMSIAQAAVWVTAGNVVLFFFALGLGHVLCVLYRRRPIGRRPGPVERGELWLAGACVLVNSGITLAGVVLWRAGFLRFRREGVLGSLADFAILLLAMDVLMYALHRVAHHRLFYSWLHHRHHVYVDPRPLTLFVMNPLETLGFGALWIGVLLVYPPSWAGLFLYLGVNHVSGMIGHLGVEPFPAGWTKMPILGWISTSSFHSHHHRDPGHNLGFYTVIWDRLLGTIAKDSALAEESAQRAV